MREKKADVEFVKPTCLPDPSSCCEILSPPDQTGENHSGPYAVTDAKAAGLRLWLAAAVGMPSEEGL